MTIHYWLAIVVVVQTLILATLCLVLYHLVQQQGRVLLRLDRVEENIASGGLFALHASAPSVPSAPAGLTVGESAPDFELQDLNGTLVRLEDFLGKRVLAVNWSPNCGYCHQ